MKENNRMFVEWCSGMESVVDFIENTADSIQLRYLKAVIKNKVAMDNFSLVGDLE